ncbi:MAG TPA: hypothetical protein VFG81_07240 [Anaerolineales bacterium]|jgi:hypothetical protein|nr:hypothetical protein [Anaerolineales bacterium]
MNENRERQIDMEVEETPQDELEHEERESVERNEARAEERTTEIGPERRAPMATTTDELEPLFEEEAAKKFRSRWLAIQSKFVDDPRDSVKQADELVADIIKNVTMNFADRRIGLEKQWNGGENISTEDMRVTLKRYRSFFERLLTLES